MMNEIEIELKKFISENDKIKQRDKTWYSSMGTTVGGSELAAITGLSSYSNLYNVVAKKILTRLGRDSMETNLACLWGTMFEDVAANYIENYFGYAPIGTEITIMSREGFRYSPDGYIICGIKKNGKICFPGEDQSLIDHYAPVMIEIKCPLMRDLKPSVPTMYLPQVLAGLEFSPPDTIGLFVDCKFRKCAVDELNESLYYDRKIHPKSHNGFKAVAWGIIGIFRPGKIDSTQYKECFTEYDVMTLIKESSECIVEYSPINCDKSQLEKWQLYEDKTLIKILPWKLLEIRFIQVNKQDGYLDSVAGKVQEVHNLVNMACENSDPIAWYINYLNEKDLPIPSEIKPKEEEKKVDTDRLKRLFTMLNLSD